jgi:hypothetical protein
VEIVVACTFLIVILKFIDANYKLNFNFIILRVIHSVQLTLPYGLFQKAAGIIKN